jgi:hypothetical protein
MEERIACALLKQKFEAAGFFIEENQPFDENGVQFDMDGFDSKYRVGYEYVTREAGDDWDVDGAVISALEDRMKKGELYVLVIDEANAPDERSLYKAINVFLKDLKDRGVVPDTSKSSTVKAEQKGARPKASTKPPPIPKPKKPPPKPPAKKK